MVAPFADLLQCFIHLCRFYRSKDGMGGFEYIDIKVSLKQELTHFELM